MSCIENDYLTRERHEELQNVQGFNFFDNAHQGWDEEILLDLCNEHDMRLIKQVPIPLLSKEDSWYWLWEHKGDFSVRSCYRKLRGEIDCQNKRFWRKLWSLQLPGKILIFLWHACKDV